eukprot:maker-scaffold_2-augustus-gene-14.1-mRNA-1 protein AED:0.30 eAED:0.30 QI:188/1/0.5/1/1/1/2/0/1134
MSSKHRRSLVSVSTARKRVVSMRVAGKGYTNMVGTEYENVGTKPGMVFFNVKRGKTTVVERLFKDQDKDEIFSGVFYDKDCYMFLVTEKKSEQQLAESTRGGSEFNWKIFIWKGARASMIQFGLAGTKANDLLKKLSENGNYHDTVILKEAQGGETEVFKAFFGGKVTVKPGNRTRRKAGVSDSVVEKTPKLYIVKHEKLNRVAINRMNILEDRSYILDTGKAVFSYSGPNCGRIERAYTEELARRRCKADYRKSIKSTPVNADSPQNLKHLFFQSVDDHEQEIVLDVNNEDDIKKLAPRLLEYKSNEKVFEELNPDKEGDALLDAEVLVGGKVFLVDCFTEMFIWIGKGTNWTDQAVASKLAHEKLKEDGRPDFCSIEILRERMEVIWFKERFFGFDQTDMMEIGGVRNRIKTESEFKIFSRGEEEEEKKKKRVSGEWKRVMQFLSEREQDFDTLQDLSLADDESGKLAAFRYTQKGEMQRMEPWEYGYFDTTEMYSYIYSCKNGTIHYIYTWEGEHASVRAKTHVGISTTGKEVGGIGENIELLGTKVFKFIHQGKEPRLLTLLLERRHRKLFLRQGNPLEKQRNQGFLFKTHLDDQNRKVFAFEINEIGKLGARTTEIPFDTLQQNGFYRKACYIIYRGPAEKQNLLRKAMLGKVDFTPTEVFYYIGDETTSDCKELTCTTSEDPALPRSLGFQDFAFAEIKPKDLSLEENQNLCDELKLKVNTEPLLPAQVRPARLFIVSNALKEVGGMFILDQGDGFFSQADLKENNIFLLDTGSTKVFLWIGSNCNKPSIELGLEAGTRYFVRHIPSGSLDKEFVLVDSGNEAMSFKNCFFGWTNKVKNPKNFSEKYSDQIERFTAIAKMDDKLRHQARQRASVQLRNKKLDTFRQENSLRRSRMRSLRKGKLMTFKRTVNEFSVADKVGDRITVNEKTNTITVNNIGKPLRILQSDLMIDDVCASVRLESSPYNWALFRYKTQIELEFFTRGSNGVDEMMEAISEKMNTMEAEEPESELEVAQQPVTTSQIIRSTSKRFSSAIDLTHTLGELEKDANDDVFFGIARIKADTLQTSLSKTDRLLFIIFIPENTRPALRAAANVHKAVVSEILGPFYTEVTLRETREFDAEKAIIVASN